MTKNTREIEMERGRVIADRARRLSDLERYVVAKKVKIMVALPGHPLHDTLYDRSTLRGHVNIFSVGGVQCCHENTAEDEYPSERVMATIALAVGATVGFDNIPPPQPTHRVSADGKAYNARLREANKHREDMK